jgi:hypothetical protein
VRRRYHRPSWLLIIGWVCYCTGCQIWAQWGEAWFDRYDFTTAREAPSHSTGTPEWVLDPVFKKDAFTFVRVRYSSPWRRHNWITDFPDSDLNFSFRLQQMTSLKVDPDARVIDLDDPDLYDFPWIYIVEPGYLRFSEEEVPILRKYLLNGGFLMLDDFWGEREYANIATEMKRVFPEREPVELSIDHPIFNCVFTIRKKPQIPNVRLGIQSEFTGVTWERPDAKNPDYRAIYDDKNRMMVLFCHNTDDGDGWEREGESEYYFREFSEKAAYPLGINIIFYSMTH